MNCRNVTTVAVALLVSSGVWIGVTSIAKKPSGARPSEYGAKSQSVETPGTPDSNRFGPEVPPGPVTKANVTARIFAGLTSLRSTASPDKARGILADLRTYFLSVPSNLAAAAITEFLADPSADCSTHLEFAVGNHGSLSGQPSLRIALLDWLGEIDPQQAGVVAKQVLSTPTAADEWAVCLRNYARANPGAEGNDFLRTKAEELIRNPNWRINPSVGFFESFDVLVHTRATRSTDLLAGLVVNRMPEGAPLAHASFLTLDRLTLREPTAMIQQLTARPDLGKARPEMLANLVARADLRDPTQQQLVRNYLLDPARTGTELTAFAGVYPNANFSISNNLLTENTTLTHAEITARDTAALAIIDAWLADPEFEPVNAHLTTMHQRLTNFVHPSTK